MCELHDARLYNDVSRSDSSVFPPCHPRDGYCSYEVQDVDDYDRYVHECRRCGSVFVGVEFTEFVRGAL